MRISGADPGFQVRGGALKKIACDLVSVGFATLYCCIYAILNGYFTYEHEMKAVSWSSTLQIISTINGHTG
jgi:hypothetical protein